MLSNGPNCPCLVYICGSELINFESTEKFLRVRRGGGERIGSRSSIFASKEFCSDHSFFYILPDYTVIGFLEMDRGEWKGMLEEGLEFDQYIIMYMYRCLIFVMSLPFVYSFCLNVNPS